MTQTFGRAGFWDGHLASGIQSEYAGAPHSKSQLLQFDENWKRKFIEKELLNIHPKKLNHYHFRMILEGSNYLADAQTGVNFMTPKSTIKEFAVFLGDRESIPDNSFSRVAAQLELLWGYQKFYLYLNKLIIAEKERSRAGFPFEAIQEFDKLKEIHERLYPRGRSHANVS